MKLKKDLGFWDVFAITSGAMISSGIFILPGIAFSHTGPSVFISYLLAGLLALFGAFSIVELASAMPRAGGDYFFITRSMGPLFGTVAGFLSWFALSLKTAFAIIGISEILHLSFGLDIILSSSVLTVIFLAINIVGVSAAGKFEIVIVLLLLGLMIFHLITGLPMIDLQRFSDFAPHGVNAIFLTAGFVFVAYGGLMQVASISEEVKNPRKNIPMGLFSSIFVVTLLYTLVTMVAVGTVDAGQLSGNLTPIASSARNILGPVGGYLLTAAALLAFISTGNAGILSASRYPFALSRDQLIPAFIDKVNPRTGTPVISILITGLIIFASFFLKLEVLVKAASTVVILSYILAQVAIIVLRESHLQNYRPSYRAPFYPWLQILSLLLFSLLLIDIGWEALLISGSLVFIAVMIYVLYGKRKNNSPFAMLRLLQRLTNQKLVAGAELEQELKEILSERDDIIFDRFDKLVDSAIITDMEGPFSLEGLVDHCASRLSEVLDISQEDIIELLLAREEESSTALNSQVAVPHIVIEGMKKFRIMIVRIKEGVHFSPLYPTIKAVFILAGTRDERQFHLQALSAIAQITLQPDFIHDWMQAQSPSNLRDILHLADRQRIVSPPKPVSDQL